MPSKEVRLVQDTIESTSDNYCASDVEELVAAIKHNLRLKSAPCHVMCTKQRRVSPYTVPVRTQRCFSSPHTCQLNHGKRKSSDPYVLLQELLKKGTLIKEAVKRLQLEASSSTKKLKMDDTTDEADSIGTNQCVSNIC